MSRTYFRTVRLHTKGRWCNRKLGDIVEEFGPSAQVKGDLNHVLQGKDIVEYTVHVHEPPVTPLNVPESIIYENDDFIVVNKPSGIPVHPTVNYYHNSVTEMLKNTYGSLYPCYRLDRLTSGILVLAKTTKVASMFQEMDKSKFYLARVRLSDLKSNIGQGDINIYYPERTQTTTLVSGNVQSANQSSNWEKFCNGAEIKFTDPIITFNGKRGYKGFLDAAANAKSACTIATLYGYDDDFATLKIKLETGRTHQIRKHLTLHGFPIQNDEIYFDEGRSRRLFTEHSEESFDEVWDYAEKMRLAKLTGKFCPECGCELYDSRIGKLDLHCFQYSFGEYSFEVPPPFPVAKTA